jgi:hypothetical protein
MRVHVALGVCALGLVCRVSASAGDDSAEFRDCFGPCAADCAGGVRNAPTDPLLRLTQWSCDDECRYACMHRVEHARRARRLAPQQYFGKWPFQRAGGCQELLSSLFSLANAAPFAYFLAARLPRMAAVPGTRRALAAYASVGLGTWLLSALFHCRDTWLTERLDMHAALLHLATGVHLAAARTLGLSRAALGVLGAALYGGVTLHVWRMHTVLFDYGGNMRVALAAAGLSLGLWLLWLVRDGWQRPYGAKVALFVLGTVAAGLLEVLDFAPVGGLLDAHALWHGLTPPLVGVLLSFLEDDARWEAARATDKRRHAV